MGIEMSELIDYIQAVATRGACMCGRCLDAPERPEDEQPTGHTADVYFFKVAVAEGADADADVLTELIHSHQGSHAECNPLDGMEHSYIEVGAWIGDQGIALTLLGLGAVLGLWELLTPKSLPGLPEGLMSQMAGAGFISISPRGSAA